MNVLKPINTENTVKQTVIRQYRATANSSLDHKLPRPPKEGWVRTIRKALGMSGTQLADRLGLSRNRISVLERKEAEGDVTLTQLRELAEQLNCDLTYALIPRKPIEEIIEDRATEIAIQSLDTNSQNMFLEAQSIDKEAQTRLMEQIKKDIIASGGRILWRKY
ncbi:mobile mystery protein A [Morganella psychrotolerans]|uniref:Mobile mystery protein A n=1 Tax=Morganella psychrotolerans TaxID=368603 RepID=A0A5M9QZN1_9GAMM|nr:mobile mystery protein A [Morganella psychrotolerans]KAA8712675.1 mobile mystery protein A [Morganella psychrotolerans]OBU06903.1 transcriptional regulator [Morganella psychrotolerans]